MENLVVILIVILAGVYVVRAFHKSWKKGSGCSCGCSGCELERSCSEARKDD